ncbi:hypothetical protein [Roseateles sp.]|jgi:hypothetical protein|uniref:hypothetical protein n=1 Tax=Roseateles sp. TaxID=1971397 RepID=UPI0037C97A62
MLPRLPSHWLRTLIWVLCLALPLQAAAVVGMSGCGSVPIGWSAAAAGSVELPTPLQHHEAAHAASDDASLHDGHAMHDAADLNHQQCSACAACFVGAALPSTPMALASAAGHPVQYSGAEWVSLDCSPSRLERPPRTTAR